MVGLLRATAEGECNIERLRQRLCENPDFEPYDLVSLLFRYES